jgi:CRP-like cAMP-binding protein
VDKMSETGPDRVVGLSAQDSKRLLKHARPFEYGAREMLCRAGGAADRIVILDDGQAHGVEALVAGDRYLIDVVTESAGTGATLDRAALALIEQQDSALAIVTHRWVAGMLAASLREADDTVSRLSSEEPGEEASPDGETGPVDTETLDFLKLLSFFREFTNDEIAHLAGFARQWRISAGRRVVAEGETGRSCFILVSGSVAVTRVAGDRTAHLARIGPGRMFGEVSLIDNVPRSATCIIGEDAVLLELPAAEFERLLGEGSDLSLKFLKCGLYGVGPVARLYRGFHPQRGHAGLCQHPYGIFWHRPANNTVARGRAPNRPPVGRRRRGRCGDFHRFGRDRGDRQTDPCIEPAHPGRPRSRA